MSTPQAQTEKPESSPPPTPIKTKDPEPQDDTVDLSTEITNAYKRGREDAQKEHKPTVVEKVVRPKACWWCGYEGCRVCGVAQ